MFDMNAPLQRQKDTFDKHIDELEKATHAKRQSGNPNYHRQISLPILASEITHNQDQWEIIHPHKVKQSLRDKWLLKEEVNGISIQENLILEEDMIVKT